MAEYFEREKVVPHIQLNEAKVAFYLLEQYVNGAVIQIERIKEDTFESTKYSGLFEISKQADLKSQRKSRDSHRQMTVDVHLYIICGDRVKVFMNYIIEKEDGPDLKLFWNKWSSKMQEFTKARDKLEHSELHFAQNLKRVVYKFDESGFSFKNVVKGFNYFSNIKTITDSYEEMCDLLERRPLATEN